MFFLPKPTFRADVALPKYTGLAVRPLVLTAALSVVTLLNLNAAQAQSAARKTNKSGANKAAGASKTGKPAAPAVAGNGIPALLLYQFTPGATVRFKVSAFFDGHFPPFAQPDAPPVHLKAELAYTATVKKVDKDGATVDFVVEHHNMYLYQREVKEDEKIDLNGKEVADMTGLTTLPDIQKALNATAILRSDGTIVRILSSSNVKIPFDVGFDIRKLFLMMLPITFANQPVKPADAWPATDGILGSKPGKTVYADRLESVAASGANTTYHLTQTAHSTVEDKLDKAGNSTAKEDDAYRALSGQVDLTSEMWFVAPAHPQAGAAKGQAGQVKSAHLVMNAVVNQKRLKIDPDQPEIPENAPLDVKARMTVVRDDSPAKTPPAGNEAKKDKDIAKKNKPGDEKSGSQSGDKTASGAK
jgi:hypothetical protein